MGETGEITEMLAEVRGGSQQAIERLIPIVYEELRRLAGYYMRQERPDHTLQATALVHEAYLRLAGQQSQDWQNRAHFFAVAAQVMRNLLVDHARARQRDKRGGGHVVPLDDALTLVAAASDDVLAIDGALASLFRIAPRPARIVELRYFGGLNVEEIAAVLGISDRTVRREWQMAKAWLYAEVRGQS
jgi:RNA polymerase sigma-70 factor (ECF subfamily)